MNLGSTNWRSQLTSLLLLCIAAYLLPAAAARAEDPMLTAGFAPNTVQSGDMTGFVNVLNGALTLTFPIGPTYPVNESLSYGLSLTYSSNLRRWSGSPGFPQFPQGRSPVGWAWSMHLGRIRPSATTPVSFSYQASDGTSYGLALKTGAANCGAQFEAGCYLSTGNTYLRAVRQFNDPGDLVGTWRLWTPDGVERVLAHFLDDSWGCNPIGNNCPFARDIAGWYTTSILDPVGVDSVTIEYDTPLKPHCMKKIWDSVRQNANSPSFEFTNVVDLNSGSAKGITSDIKVRASDGLISTYHLTYEWVSAVPRPCHDAGTGAGPNLPILRSISLQRGASSLVTAIGYEGSPVGAGIPWVPNLVDLPGNLASAAYDWECIDYEEFGDCPLPPSDCRCSDTTSQVYGVQAKRVLRGTGTACDAADVDCWSYQRCLTIAYDEEPRAYPCGPVNEGTPYCNRPTNPVKVIVTEPGQPTSNGDRKRHSEVHYFTSACNNFNGGEPNGHEVRVDQYGGPVTINATCETINGNSPLLRRTTREYEGDGTTWGNDRAFHERTEFLDGIDPDSEAPRVNFHDILCDNHDGRGHYQRVTETTSEGISGTGVLSAAGEPLCAYGRRPQSVVPRAH